MLPVVGLYFGHCWHSPPLLATPGLGFAAKKGLSAASSPSFRHPASTTSSSSIIKLPSLVEQSQRVLVELHCSAEARAAVLPRAAGAEVLSVGGLREG